MKSKIKIIGVGGGGSNAVSHMYNQGIRGVDFILCNTDKQALEVSPVPVKIQLGSNLTDGMGAGSIPDVGKKSAIESIEELKEMLKNNTKMVLITAGMGGGTGTGAAPVIASVAKELGILTVGIVTIPFMFEGRKRRLQADQGIEEMRKYVDTLLIICNDKLRELLGDQKLSEAFKKADDILTTAAKGIAEIITVTGYINVDFNDVNTVMKNSGVAIMGTGLAEGEKRAINAVEMALSSPLLNDNDINGAQNILLYIASGKEEISMDEVTEITDYIQEAAGSTAEIIWGNGIDDSLENKISVTLIATGFNAGKKIEDIAFSDRVVNIFNEPFDRKCDQIFYSFSSLKVETEKVVPENDIPLKQNERVEKLKAMSEKLKSAEGLEQIEKEPAYIRRNIPIISTTPHAESEISKGNIDDEENKVIDHVPFGNENEIAKKRSDESGIIEIPPEGKQVPIMNIKNEGFSKTSSNTASKRDTEKNRNPQTGKELMINAKKVAKCKASYYIESMPLKSDKVHFSVSSPSFVKPGQSFIIDVWAHLEKQRKEVKQRIQQAKTPQYDSPILRPKGPYIIGRGSVLFVRLNIQDLYSNQNDEEILWDGDIANADFEIDVPKDISEGYKNGNISVYYKNGFLIARVPLQILVKKASDDIYTSINKVPHIRKAFASYASTDRNEVIGRIQGMQKILPDLDVFLDVAMLRSGEDWEKKLETVIPENDVFYLFWSAAAKASLHVEKEWKYALSSKGIDFIDPVPLVSPEIVPPPDELCKKHFNDWTLAYKRGGEYGLKPNSYLHDNVD